MGKRGKVKIRTAKGKMSEGGGKTFKLLHKTFQLEVSERREFIKWLLLVTQVKRTE